MQSTWDYTALLAVFVLGGNVSSNFAQEVPWDVFVDPETGAACDVVNAGNLEVVVLSDTGELVIVTGNDYALDEAAYVEDGIFFEGIPLGQIAFADDGGGVRTLWLLDLGDNVLELDPDTGEPIFTNRIPGDFAGVPCDAFELWDDDDFDDVSDVFDLCPDTPPNTFVTEDGCPCELSDEDDDEINDCFDDCPSTPFGTVVDSHGCEIVVEPPPAFPVFITCGNFSMLTMTLTFGALVTLRLARRRHS